MPTVVIGFEFPHDGQITIHSSGRFDAVDERHFVIGDDPMPLQPLLSAVTRQFLIETDGRGRTNLSKLSKNGRFLARREEDGTIVLEPATIVTAAQERLLRNPKAIDAIRAGRADRAAGRTTIINHAEDTDR